MSVESNQPEKQVPCPQCGTLSPFNVQKNPWRPFCSERCRSIDLGAWASESYRMPTRPAPDDDTPDTPPTAEYH